MSWSNVTLGITCAGNIDGLRLCLASVLCSLPPERILLRLEGSLPGFDDFYLAQLASLCTLKGVELTIIHAPSHGVRWAKQRLLDQCLTDYLLILDDDVLVDKDCLAELSLVLNHLQARFEHDRDWGFLCAAKYDVNNRRNYADFSANPVELPLGSLLEPLALQNLPYVPSAKANATLTPSSFRKLPPDACSRLHPTRLIDAGAVLLNLKVLRAHSLGFEFPGVTVPCTGEDTLLALRCDKANLQGFFAPLAHVIHLEKPRSNFPAGGDAKELLLRICDLEGLDHELVMKGRYSWIT